MVTVGKEREWGRGRGKENRKDVPAGWYKTSPGLSTTYDRALSVIFFSFFEFEEIEAAVEPLTLRFLYWSALNNGSPNRKTFNCCSDRSLSFCFSPSVFRLTPSFNVWKWGVHPLNGANAVLSRKTHFFFPDIWIVKFSWKSVWKSEELNDLRLF